MSETKTHHCVPLPLVVKGLTERLPEHKASLTLEHNAHKNYFKSVDEHIADLGLYRWRNDKDKQRAIDTDELWTLQWYPDTPVGFQAIAAPTLFALLEYFESEVEEAS